jgi:hypothetical protein
MAVLNCKLPESLNGKVFSVLYEYWASDEPDKIMKSTLNRTYTEDTFTSLDSQLVMGINSNKQYSFRAVLYIIESNKNEIHYSNVVNFIGALAPTAIVDFQHINGYVAPDFKAENGTGRDGFKVVLNEGADETYTDKDGFFSFNVANSTTVYYKIRISKPGYIERIIDLGYDSFSKSTNQNGPYTVMLCGDLNQDNCINMNDIMQMAQVFNTTKGVANFDETSDLNRDNAVNMADIMLAAKNFNKSVKDYLNLPIIPYVELESDKDILYPKYAYPNQTVTVSLNAYNMKNLGGYGINVTYDPKILQPIDYTDDTTPEDGDMLINTRYSPLAIAKNDLTTGILFFGKSYINLPSYKNSGKGEDSGKLASIKFKLIGTPEYNKQFIVISKTKAIPENDRGVQLFDWDGNPIEDFEIIQPRIKYIPAIP